MINPSDITVVVQGPVLGEPWLRPEHRLTARVLKRARELLPGAVIVLSTWADQPTAGLDADVVVTSDDPGALPLKIDAGRVTAWNNINRQIVSAAAGLRAARTPYAIKMRTDITLDSIDFLSYFDRFTKPDPEWTVLGQRVLASAFHSRLGPNRTSYRPQNFHPNDWFYFGRTTDVLDLWDLALMTEDDARFFTTRAKPAGVSDQEELVSRYVAEQYAWVTFLRKHRPVAFESYLDHAPAACALGERTIAANLVLLDPHQLSMTSLKYPAYVWLKGWRNFRGRYSHRLWTELYRRYADPVVRLAPGPTFAYARRFARGILRHAPGATIRRVKAAVAAWLELNRA